MIQRIQSLYLLATGVLAALMFWLPMAGVSSFDAEFRMTACSISQTGAEVATAHYTVWLAILVAFTAILPLVIIFLYKNRVLQLRLCFAQIVLLVGTLGLEAYYIYNFSSALKGVSADAWTLMVRVPALFPLAGIILVLLAIRSISKDERLVRSLDRLR